jgi:hypothetical protein
MIPILDSIISAKQFDRLLDKSCLEVELEDARRTAEYWKAEHLEGNKRISELEAEVAELRDRILDTGPILPKNGITIRYTEPEKQ